MFATVQELKEDSQDLFKTGTGLTNVPVAHINLKKEVNPQFFKSCSLPYALRRKVASELDRMSREGILFPVSHSDWTTTVVFVLKPDGRLRICLHFKVTLTLACDIEQYPLPKVDDIFPSFKDGYWFSKFHLRSAYCHVPLDEESKQVAMLNIRKGLLS